MYVIMELERLFRIFNEEFFGTRLLMPVFKITYRKREGWYMCMRAGRQYEISLNKDRLFDDTDTIILSLIHQMIHIYCSMNNIKDTSRGGQYHNDKFTAVAEGIGICMEPKKHLGYIMVGIEKSKKDNLEKYIKNVRERLDEAIAKDKLEELEKLEFKNFINWKCPRCGRMLKASKDANVICGWCCVRYIRK